MISESENAEDAEVCEEASEENTSFNPGPLHGMAPPIDTQTSG